MSTRGLRFEARKANETWGAEGCAAMLVATSPHIRRHSFPSGLVIAVGTADRMQLAAETLGDALMAKRKRKKAAKRRTTRRKKAVKRTTRRRK